MTTPIQHLEIFDEKLWKIFRDNQFVKSTNSVTGDVEEFPDAITDMEATISIHGEFDKYDIEKGLKQHLIQTVISVLEEQINHEVKLLRIVECEEGCPFCDRGLQRKCNAYESDREWNEAKQNTIDSLTTTLSTWQAMLKTTP